MIKRYCNIKKLKEKKKEKKKTENSTCFLLLQSSTASLAIVAPITTSNGATILRAVKGANGLNETHATMRK